MISNEKVYSIGQIAKIFRVGRATVQRWIKSEKMMHYELPSGHTRCKYSDIREFATNYKLTHCLDETSQEEHESFQGKAAKIKTILVHNADRLHDFNTILQGFYSYKFLSESKDKKIDSLREELDTCKGSRL